MIPERGSGSSTLSLRRFSYIVHSSNPLQNTPQTSLNTANFRFGIYATIPRTIMPPKQNLTIISPVE